MIKERASAVAKEAAQAFIIENVGVHYRDASFDIADHTAAIELFMTRYREGRLLVVQGIPSSGKTFAAVCWMRNEIELSTNLGTFSACEMVYVTATEFERLYCQPGYQDADIKNRWDKLLRAKWAVLDDLGTEDPKNTKFKSRFYEFFDYRYRHEKTLIILTNIEIESYDERISSRIKEWADDGYVWELDEGDMRGIRHPTKARNYGFP